MNRTPFSRALNSRPRVSAAPFQTAPGAAHLAASVHEARREVARALARDSRVLLRDGSRLDVRLVAYHEEGDRAPGARHPASPVRAGDAREADVIVHQEFPGGGAVVGPGAMQLAFVVAVGRLRRDVEDRPVGDVPEQEVDILGHVLRLVQRRRP